MNNSRTLWNKVNYRYPYKFIIDNPICEYDISKANISVLRDANIISEEQYQYLYHAPKDERSITVGKMQKSNSAVTATLKAGIANARKTFMEINDLYDSDIMEIRNDAMVVLTDRQMKLDITDRVKFRLAESYRSYYRIGFLDMYYDYNPITNIEILDIKGIGDDVIAWHKDYILDFFKELFYTAQIEGIGKAIELVSTFYGHYINLELDIGYYRELRNNFLLHKDGPWCSGYKFSNGFTSCGELYADHLTNYDKIYIDISYNAELIREASKMLSSAYFK